MSFVLTINGSQGPITANLGDTLSIKVDISGAGTYTTATLQLQEATHGSGAWTNVGAAVTTPLSGGVGSYTWSTPIPITTPIGQYDIRVSGTADTTGPAYTNSVVVTLQVAPPSIPWLPIGITLGLLALLGVVLLARKR
jgi:hypothetical protein